MATIMSSLVGGLLVLSVVIVVIFSSVQAHKEAVAAEAERQAETAAAVAAKQKADEIFQSLAKLQTDNPGTQYVLYPGDTGSIKINKSFSQIAVTHVDISKQNNSALITVGIVGIAQKDVAAIVYVSFYDKNGALLAASPIVKFADTSLSPGETREVTDSLDIPTGSEPQIVGILGN